MEITDISVLMVLMLFGAAFIAGFIDVLVGGGGLITIPALLAAGLSPLHALGTNKFQSCAGTMSASILFFSRKKVSFKKVKVAMLSAFLAALIGAICVQLFNTNTLNLVIPLVIVLIGLYFLLSPKVHDSQPREIKMNESTYYMTAVPAVGFYDGMFGPGTGSFFTLAGVSLRGQTIIEATCVAKVLNFSTNLGALLVFVFLNKVAWGIGLVMLLGQMAGASIGARVLLRINPMVLRSLVVVMCFIMLSLWLLNNSAG